MGFCVCTLFEGKYHLGVSVLVNSLYRNGFNGNVYIGYRGALPPWSNGAVKNETIKWEGDVMSLLVKEDLHLHFLPLSTKVSLTNYKPDFMLDLLRNSSTTSEGIFYFDPDIVNVAPFGFLKDWTQYGIALAADVNAQLGNNHPRRMAWRSIFKKYDIELDRDSDIYVNGGFIGIEKIDIAFLELWKNAQNVMAKEIGGLDKSIFSEKPKIVYGGDFDPFSKTDQDALNIAVHMYKGNVSIVGREAMAFEPGLVLFPHALGHGKPWDVKMLLFWLRGRQPRFVDKVYWEYADSPVKIYSDFTFNKKRFLLKVWSFLSRFYKKN